MTTLPAFAAALVIGVKKTLKIGDVK